VTYLCLNVIESYVLISTLFSVCRTWIDDSFTGIGHYLEVNRLFTGRVVINLLDGGAIPRGKHVVASHIARSHVFACFI
jgi:hypothetical protein